ncbi:hypothetical protein V8G54_013530 [Vigna mungo]|uniref:Wall-associated receptor kinase C-terminal domain-containing protein n=1 Tax=Vigna mungo TaxID=3915 RepID=A0AAQ3S4Z9_VIGMU
MDDKYSHIHTSPLAFALTVSCFFCIAFPHSHSQTLLLPPPSPPPPPPLCAEQSYMCNIKVSGSLEPVWKQIPPSQCIGADPSPQLSCSVPYYESQNFTLKKVNHTTHTMTVVPTHTVNDLCSHDVFYIYDNLNNSLLQHYESVHNVIVFFGGCPQSIPDFPLECSFKCGDAAFYFGEEDEMLHKVPASLLDCKRRLLMPIAAPLDHYYNKDGGAEVLTEALADGFEVSYSPLQHCTGCNQSIGNCWNDGYDYDGDVVSCNYYCPNKYCSSKRSGMCSLLISYTSLPQNPLFSYSLPIFSLIYSYRLTNTHFDATIRTKLA